MEQEVKQANQMPQEEEIDLVEVVRKLWKNLETDTEDYSRVYGTRGISGPV